MNTYPTREGIAVPIYELSLPASRYGWEKKKHQNNHHNHWTEKKFARRMGTLALRNLSRHQFEMPVDVHRWLHDTYAPPELPTDEQAAREVIDAYDQGEQFKIYDKFASEYLYHPIPLELVDQLVAVHGLRRVFDMAAD